MSISCGTRLIGGFVCAACIGSACGGATALGAGWAEHQSRLAFDGGASADTQPEAKAVGTSGDRWRVRVSPYLWIPAQDGDLSVRGNPANVDLSVSDIFESISDNFDAGGAVHLEFSNDKLTLFADAMYLSLQTNEADLNGTRASVRQEQGIFELGVAFRAGSVPGDDGGDALVFEPLGGVRVQHLSLDIDPKGVPSAGGDQTWVDGFVGARARLSFGDRLDLQIRADIGAGHSDFTWSAMAGAEFRIADGVLLSAGYRALRTDYDDGHGASRFEYDMLLHGPFVSLTLEF